MQQCHAAVWPRTHHEEPVEGAAAGGVEAGVVRVVEEERGAELQRAREDRRLRRAGARTMSYEYE